MEVLDRVVIFGAGGQDGHYLEKLLKPRTKNLFLYDWGHTQYPSLDVGDYKVVSKLIDQLKPSVVFHLAARSTTRHDAILENHNAIVNGAISILEAVDRFSPGSKVFLASSGLIFKNDGAPINENNELVVDNAYSLARVEALYCARYYRQRGAHVYVGYLYNHESPRRPQASVVRQVADGVVRLGKGLDEKLVLGNPEVIKEWTWAGDIARGILTMIDQDEVYESNIGSGIGHSVMEFAEACGAQLGLDLARLIESQPHYVEQYESFTCNPERIMSLGWKPMVGLNELAKIMVDARK